MIPDDDCADDDPTRNPSIDEIWRDRVDQMRWDRRAAWLHRPSGHDPEHYLETP